MVADQTATVRRCATCRAELLPGAERCWLCGAGAPVGEAALLDHSAQGVRTSSVAPRASFSLSTLMLFVTLTAIVCGVSTVAPGLGIALALVLLPLLAQTVVLARREKELGVSLNRNEKVLLILGSLGLVCLAGIAAAIAFGIACFAGFLAGSAAGEALGVRGEANLGWGAMGGIGLGSIAGLYVGYRALLLLLKGKGYAPLSSRSKVLLGGALILVVVGALVWLFVSGL